MTEVVGSTPLVRLNKVVPADYAAVFVKLESHNPTGSYKDRISSAMIDEAPWQRLPSTPGSSI